MRTSALVPRGRGPAEGHRIEAELAVIPGAGPGDVEPDGDPLVQHHLDERLELVGVRAVVALPHVDPHRPQRLGVLDDLGPSLEGDTAQNHIPTRWGCPVAPMVARLAVRWLATKAIISSGDISICDRWLTPMRWLQGWRGRGARSGWAGQFRNAGSRPSWPAATERCREQDGRAARVPCAPECRGDYASTRTGSPASN